MTTPGGERQRAHVWPVVIGLSLLGLGTAATLLSGSAPGVLHPKLYLPWYVLVPVYVLFSHLTVDFEYRKEAHSVALTQLPLAVGLVLLNPVWHLLACLLAALFDSAVVRRQQPMKIAYNSGSAVVQVGLPTLAVSLIGRSSSPGPALWAGLLIGLMLSDVLCHFSLLAILRSLGVRTPREQVFAPLAFGALSTSVFSSLSIVAVTSMWTTGWALVVMAALGVGLSFAYRVHRRLFAQQRSTERLYEFVRDLGPLDINADQADDVLEQVRVLLHANTLDLALTGGAHQIWRHLMAFEGDAPQDVTALDEVTHQVATGGRAALEVADKDRMTVPLLGMSGIIGALTVHDRIGTVRGFDMGDLRLLETVAAELATALERGRLLSDLGRAATTDPLTGMPNLAEVTHQVDLLLQTGQAMVVAAVAVDSFREINDTLGHQVGDDLLVEVTRRLHLSHPDAILGRIGGGRFAVAVPAGDTGDDPSMFGLGIRAQVEGGAQLGPVGTHVRLSVGCVMAPEHGSDGATLVRRAETAMYSARHVHGGPVLWEPAYEVQGQRRLAVVMALREALSSGAIGVAFQPKLDARTGFVTGVEALARWTHPALGSIRPDEFIPLAEASGLMGPLTSTVLRQSLTACKGWQRRGGRVGVAVNVSAETVLDAGFVTELAALLTAVDIAPDLLTIELTESVLVADPVLASERINELRAHGVKLSVDDFGTGYSSLTYLKGLPVDEVKIDKGFVDDVVDDAGDRAVVRAVVDIAHTLGLRVVAEGVEQDAQHLLLAELGVDEIQGYLHARPMPALDMAAWLRRRDVSTLV